MRIGWKSPSPRRFINADGVLLDLDQVCPLQVKLHAEDDILRAEAASSTLATRIGGPPDLEPLRNFITSKKVRGTRAASSLAALGEGGCWAQERLFQEGRAPDPYCRACAGRQSLGPPIGTIHHRCCACPATADLREAHKGQEIINKAQSALHGREPLFCHGVPILLPKPAVPEHSVRCCGGRQPPADFTFTGNAFTDGALRGCFPKACRRGGWACVLVGDNADVIAGFYGPCADHYPTAFRAELRAVIELLVLAAPPINIFVDNQEVIDGWVKGQPWCCSVGRSAADLWRVFWHRVQDIGQEGISIIKCKGHATLADVQAGRSTPFTRKGNDHADHFAGRGVDVAEEMVPSAQWRLQSSEARQWYGWLCVLCSRWPQDVDLRPRCAAKKEAKPKAKSSRLAMAKQGAPAAVVIEDQSLARAKTLHQSHQLKSAGQLIWCDSCGAYGQHRFKDLKTQCCGEAKSSKLGQLIALREGRHPLTGVKLGATSAVKQSIPVWVGRAPPCKSHSVQKAVEKLQELCDRRTACALGKLLSLGASQ